MNVRSSFSGPFHRDQHFHWARGYVCLITSASIFPLRTKAETPSLRVSSHCCRQRKVCQMVFRYRNDPGMDR